MLYDDYHRSGCNIVISPVLLYDGRLQEPLTLRLPSSEIKPPLSSLKLVGGWKSVNMWLCTGQWMKTGWWHYSSLDSRLLWLSGGGDSISVDPPRLWLRAARSPPTTCHWTRLLATPQFLVEKPENLASIFCPHILKTVAGSALSIATLVISKIFPWYQSSWYELSVLIMVDWINKSKPRCNFCCLALNPKPLP